MLVPKTYQNLCTCQICFKQFQTKRPIGSHIQSHKITADEYYKKYFLDTPITQQTCTQCGIEKPIENFYFRKETNEYRLDCKDCQLKQKVKYHQDHKEKRNIYCRAYYKNNSEKLIEYTKQRRKSHIHVHLRTVYSNKINKHLKMSTIKKLHSNIELLGCTIAEFRKHIESLFTNGMSWENHGSGSSKWNLEDSTECKICFHYSNYRPLWQLENLSKNDKLLPLNLINTCK